MACVRVELDHAPYDGEMIKFKAPCDCSEVDSLRLYYPVVTETAVTEASTSYSFRDAHKNDLQNTPNLFAEGAYVSAVLDTVNKYAFLQNADNNGFLSNIGRMLFNNTDPPLTCRDEITISGLHRYTVIAVSAGFVSFIAVHMGDGENGQKVFRGKTAAHTSGVFKDYTFTLHVGADDSLAGDNVFFATDADGNTEEFNVYKIIGIC